MSASLIPAAQAGGVAQAGAPAAWLNAARVLFIVGMMGTFTSPPVVNIALGLALIALVPALASGGVRAGFGRSLRQPLPIGALILMATMAAAMLWADADWRHRFGAWWSWRTLLLAALGSALFGEARWKERFCFWFVGVLTPAAVASFVAWSMHYAPIDDPGVILRNHGTQGMAMTAGAVIAAVLAFKRPYSNRVKWLLFAAAVLFVGNVALVARAGSGYAALVAAGGIGAFSLVRGRRRWIALLLVPVVAAGVLAASPAVRSRLAAAYEQIGTVQTSPIHTPIGMRLVIWDITVDLIRQRPWFGYGVGGFAPAYAQLVHQRYSGWQGVDAKDTHNQYLHLEVEAGVLGLLAFAAFVAGAVRQPAAQPYRACGLALLTAWLATGLFNSHFQTFNEAHMIELLLGVLLAYDPDSASAAATAPATSS